MRKILLIRFSSLGDIIITTAFIEACKKLYPDAKFYILTKESYKDIFLFNPNIEKVFTISNNKTLLQACKDVNKENIDNIFDLHNNIRSRIASFLIRGNVRRYKKGAFQRRIFVLFKKYFGGKKTVRQRYLECLDSYMDIKDTGTRLYADEAEMREADKILYFDSRYRYIAINPGAKWNTKRWIKEKYAELITALSDGNTKIALLGDSNDIGFNQSILDCLKTNRKSDIIDLTNKLTLRQLFAVIGRCGRVITTDSAVLHIAQAEGVPVTAVFGPTVKEFGFWEPKEGDAIVEKNIKCRPCSLHGSKICPKKHFKCMKSIEVQDIVSQSNLGY